ncbi:MAG: response regulator [Spirochaeta sp.]|nr:response regulator [Spirochaeta sp.]
MLDLFVVEDEDIEREALIELIRRRHNDRVRLCGFARTGTEAEERITILWPDIVFLDIQIPEFDGLEVARRIRDAGSHAQVVVITAYSRFDYAQKAIRIGAVDYLVKPYSMRTLNKTLDAAIARITAEPSSRPHPETPVDRARDFALDNYTRDISLDEVARHCGMSKYHLSRRFHAEIGMGLKEFIIRRRIELAAQFLRDGLTVGEAALAAGFSDPNYFGRAVKKHLGVTPRELR